jgi:hypothetical protein
MSKPFLNLIVKYSVHISEIYLKSSVCVCVCVSHNTTNIRTSERDSYLSQYFNSVFIQVRLNDQFSCLIQVTD